jgi:glycerophosphoryl diester phosphodiesterase
MLYGKKMATSFLCIAHRGASGHAPENTIAAVEKAIELGAGAVELDIRQTADGHLVVIHDASLQRTAGSSKPVGSISLAELKTLDAGSWWKPSFRDERVPTLAEVLETIRHRCYLFIDLKQGSAHYPLIESRLLELIREWNAYHWVTVASPDLDALRKLRAIDPRLRLGIQPRLVQVKRILDIAEEVSAESIHLATHRFRPPILSEAHRKGVKVYLYTVNRPALIQRYARLGVDGIFTNYPDRPEAALRSDA